MSAKRVLIDTSVWIDYLRNKSSPIADRVDNILSEDDVYIPKIVIAELIQGAKSEKEISVIEDFLDAFHIIDQTEDSWLKAGRLAYSLKKKARLSVCLIVILPSSLRNMGVKFLHSTGIFEKSRRRLKFHW